MSKVAAVCGQHGLALAVTVALAFLAVGDVVADIITDGTLGPIANLTGDMLEVGENLGTRSGNNLFQSFLKFDVDTGQVVVFSADGAFATEHIIGRVTGGDLSSVDGLIRNSVAGADLWLINPAGFVFGANAALDVQGSFHVSTADYLAFGDGTAFSSSDDGQAPRLTVASPVAFGFMDAPLAGVTVSGSELQVPDGETMSFSGAFVRIDDAVLRARSGMIGIAGVASAGELAISDERIDAAGFSALGDVTVSEADSGDRELNADVSGAGAGRVFIRGRSFVLDGAEIGATTEGAIDGGRIDIEVSDNVLLTNESGIFSQTVGSGAGASVSIVAGGVDDDGDRTVDIKGRSQIRSESHGSGNGGDISIGTTGFGDFRIDGTKELDSAENAGIFAVAYADGDGGSIDVETDSKIVIRRGGAIATNTLGDGHGGDVRVSAAGIVDIFFDGLIAATTEGAGDGGSIYLSADGLSMRSAAKLRTNAFGSGDGGDIEIDVANDVIVDGVRDKVDDDGRRSFDASAIGLRTKGTGDGGNLTIRAGGEFSLTGGAQIRAETFAAGDAGDVRIFAPGGVTVSGGQGRSSNNGGAIDRFEWRSAIRAKSSGSSGDAGTVLIDTRSPGAQAGDVIVSAGGQIDVSAERGSGSAGLLDIRANNLKVSGGNIRLASQFGTSATATGGSALIVVDNQVIVEDADAGNGKHFDGQIRANASDSAGSGGDIRIDARVVKVQKGGEIATNTNRSAGDGGNITIIARDLVEIRSKGHITAESFGDGDPSTPSGDGGTIAITVKSGNLKIIGTTNPNASGDKDDSTGIFARTGTNGVREGGAGGSIALDVSGQIRIVKGGNIETTTKSASAGGTIDIKAGRLVIETGGGIIALSQDAGDGGNIEIRVDDDLVIDGTNASRIDANSVPFDSSKRGSVAAATGRAGNISIVAGGDVVIRSGSGPGGGKPIIRAQAKGLGDGGGISIDAANIRLEGGKISASTIGPGDAGNISLTTGELKITGNGIIENATILQGDSPDRHASGDGGDIDIHANDVTLINGRINASSQDNANGRLTGSPGSIRIVALDTLTMRKDGNSNTTIRAITNGEGDGGSVEIDAGAIMIGNGADITASTTDLGAGGSVLIRARNGMLVSDGSRISAGTTDRNNDPDASSGGSVEIDVQGGLVVTGTLPGQEANDTFISAATNGTGTGGSVSIVADTILVDNGEIGSNSTRSSSNGQGGDAGSVSIAADALTIRNSGSIAIKTAGTGDAGQMAVAVSRLEMDGGRLVASTEGSGAGGSILLEADSVDLRGESLISASSRGSGAGGSVSIVAGELNLSDLAGILSDSESTGRAGDISIQSLILNMSGGMISASTSGTADGGDLLISSGSLTMADGALITAASTMPVSGAGNAGSIDIQVADDIVMRNASIATSAQLAAGGSIRLSAGGTLWMRESSITAEANGLGAGDDGGNVDINLGEFLILDQSDIFARANAGNGGNIGISANAVIQSADSRIDASSQKGVDGSVAVESPNDITGAIVELDSPDFDVSQLLAEQCGSQQSEDRSSFTMLATAPAAASPANFQQAPARSVRRSPLAANRSIEGAAFCGP